MATLTREEEIKTKICREYFADFDWKIVGNIDLTIASRTVFGAPTTFLWAETKRGTSHNIYESLIQLILTIGKAKTYERELPPYYLGAADAEKIAFVEYSEVMHIFSKTDFNWNVTPSDHSTKEFKELYALLSEDLKTKVLIFKFAYEDKILKKFIKKNFKEGRARSAQIPVNKNNFTFVYYDWVKSVKPSIKINWDDFGKSGILDCDFFLADLMSKDDMSIREKLKVVLEKTKYKILQKAEHSLLTFSEVEFKDGMEAYRQFWNRYSRPPKPVYQKYILDRHDLLVPQSVREVKGSYYTPAPWVRLSQEYIAKTLGEDWQDEYYVWDCAAGTGNLLQGLTNKYRIFASTLDDTDVKIMHNAIDEGRLNLVKDNVFQFDFLNDDFKKLPKPLLDIINDPERRQRLVLYLNPPYAEAGSGKTSSGTGSNKAGVAKGNETYKHYKELIKTAANELFALFFIRISREIPGVVLAEFSTLKILQAPNFEEFRKRANMSLRSLFVVPGKTFDNVKGEFPIGFFIWRTGEANVVIEGSVDADVYTLSRGKDVIPEGRKKIDFTPRRLLNDWVRDYRGQVNKDTDKIYGYQVCHNNDFQNAKYINLYNADQASAHRMQIMITENNLLVACVYNAIRHAIAPDWLNDRDQFLYPKDEWATDMEFQTDCLVWTLFNNAVRELDGICHWIPYYEDEVNSPAPFGSRFMADFIHGKITRKPIQTSEDDIFSLEYAWQAAEKKPIDEMSDEAKAVYDAGREIWKYYMSKEGCRANASFLDIRSFFQGYKTTERGKQIMSSTSSDLTYTALLSDLRSKEKDLEERIEEKIYEYGFLLK